MTAAYTLPRERRLRRAADFKRAYASGQRHGNEWFTASVQRSGAHGARLGMSVAARILRRAVDRNRMRRVIRESFRLHQQMFDGIDIVIGVRAAALGADNARLRLALQQLWQKIATACDRSCAS